MEVKFTTNDPIMRESSRQWKKEKFTISVACICVCVYKKLSNINQIGKKSVKMIGAKYHRGIKWSFCCKKGIGLYIDKLLFVVNFWACHGELMVTTAAVKYDEHCAKKIKYWWNIQTMLKSGIPKLHLNSESLCYKHKIFFIAALWTLWQSADQQEPAKVYWPLCDASGH